jgi:type IV pilus assembly protein PilN
LRFGYAEVHLVILINLLPHREEARKRRRETFYATLGASALLGGLICGAIYSWYQAQISTQQAKNTFLRQEITKLDGQIKEIASLQAELASLKARQEAVESLQSDRNMPVHLLSELVVQLPDGVYINSMKQENRNILLAGVAQSNERVSELLRNLANNSPWMSKPELIEIVAGNVNLSPRDQRRVANFSIRVALKPAVEPAKAGASAPAAPASAPKKV